MTRRFTDNELQQAFDLTRTLHPSEEVALRVVIDACDVTDVLERIEARRERSINHYKSSIPPEAILQFGVFVACYVRELDQESPLPRLEPRYKPTRDDLLVRYVKHLVWKTLLINNCSYLAVGLGCLLYNYKPKEIADLGLFDDDRVRHIKKSIKDEMMERFSGAGVITAEGTRERIRTILADDYDRMLVHEALKSFTPWHSPHFSLAVDQSLLETLFRPRSPLNDWDRKHAFLDPECGGLERLITEYNNFYASYRKGFEDPHMRLFVPDFEGHPTPPVNRFKTRKLTTSEIMLLRERHEPSGPWAYDEDALLPYLDDCGLGDPIKKAHLKAVEETRNESESEKGTLEKRHYSFISWTRNLDWEPFEVNEEPLMEKKSSWLPAPVRRYGDYIPWLQSQPLEEAERFWREKLQGLSVADDALTTESFLWAEMKEISKRIAAELRVRVLFILTDVELQGSFLLVNGREIPKASPYHWFAYRDDLHVVNLKNNRDTWFEPWLVQEERVSFVEEPKWSSSNDLKIAGGNPARATEWWEDSKDNRLRILNCCYSEPLACVPEPNIYDSFLLRLHEFRNENIGSNIDSAAFLRSRLMLGGWDQLSALTVSPSRIDETTSSSPFPMRLDSNTIERQSLLALKQRTRGPSVALSSHLREHEHHRNPTCTSGVMTSDRNDSVSAREFLDSILISRTNADKTECGGGPWTEFSFPHREELIARAFEARN